MCLCVFAYDQLSACVCLGEAGLWATCQAQAWQTTSVLKFFSSPVKSEKAWRIVRPVTLHTFSLPSHSLAQTFADMILGCAPSREPLFLLMTERGTSKTYF